ncbi:peptidoglycan-N-acetylglucosamine deacetylase [uncultured Gammaproteobacteria bacterium]
MSSHHIIDRRRLLALAGGLLGGTALASRAAWAEGSSMAARQGQAAFESSHLYPGSGVKLSVSALKAMGENVLALTFDDGPDPVNDREIMRILAEYKAAATFFVIGRNAQRHMDVVAEMVAAGHEIGNHSFNHPMLTSKDVDQQAQELRQTNDLLALAGVPVRWFRPPYGDFDSLTVTVARAEGMETILWSVDSRDWKGGAPSAIAGRVTSHLTPGAVVLMHSTRHTSVQALIEIMASARASGYRFVTMSQWKEIMLRSVPPAAQTRPGQLAPMPAVAVVPTITPFTIPIKPTAALY